MITYNFVREAVADGVISMTHVMSENNYSGLLIKALHGEKHYDMYKIFMFIVNIDRKECNFSL